MPQSKLCATLPLSVVRQLSIDGSRLVRAPPTSLRASSSSRSAGAASAGRFSSAGRTPRCSARDAGAVGKLLYGRASFRCEAAKFAARCRRAAGKLFTVSDIAPERGRAAGMFLAAIAGSSTTFKHGAYRRTPRQRSRACREMIFALVRAH
jgi:hypothetical protein